MSNYLRPYGLKPARFLGTWDCPGKNTGVGCRALLQGDLPDPGMEPVSLLGWEAGSLPLGPSGKPLKLCIHLGKVSYC